MKSAMQSLPSSAAAQAGELPAIRIQTLSRTETYGVSADVDVGEIRLSHYTAALAQVDEDEPCFFTRMGEIQNEGMAAHGA